MIKAIYCPNNIGGTYCEVGELHYNPVRDIIVGKIESMGRDIVVYEKNGPMTIEYVNCPVIIVRESEGEG